MIDWITKKCDSLNGTFGIQLFAIKKINLITKSKTIKDEFYFYYDNCATVYISPDDVRRVREFVSESFKEDRSYFKKALQEAYDFFDDFRKKEFLFKQFLSADQDAKNIKKWLRDFCDYASDVTALAFLLEMVAGFGDDYWQKYLGITKDDFFTLVAPEELSYTKKFDLELAKIKLGKLNKDIDDIVRDWYWVFNNYRIVDILDRLTVEKQLDEMKKEGAEKIITEIQSYILEIKSKKVDIFSKLNLNPEQVDILQSLSSFVVLQDHRKEIIVKTNSYFQQACNKLLDIYKFNSLDRKIIFESAFPTWFYDLSSKDLLNMSQMALEGFYAPVSGGTLVAEKANKKLSEKIGCNFEFLQQQVKGQTAFRGIVNGRVSIIIKNEDFAKFRDGDIIVTSMTRPEFVPIMQKAAAFVTDEGGITCHAAIVAREMKKPCVIGTKIATRTFKDGDMVEVDAEKGIVKIIK